MTPDTPTDRMLTVAMQAAIEGARELMKVYGSDRLDVELKSDNSPVTRADKASDRTIASVLGATGLPVLSEESLHEDYEQRRHHRRLWIVDPLDGTKEFIKRNGQFAVCIALAEEGRAVLGVIFVPCEGRLYWGASGHAWRLADRLWQQHTTARVLTRPRQSLPLHGVRQPLTVYGSVSHPTPHTDTFVARLAQAGIRAELVRLGSAIKMCRMAEGNAALYPRFGTTMEWDTAAGQAILEQVGGCLHAFPANSPMRYNRPVLRNPDFLAVAPGVDARKALAIMETVAGK